MIKKTHFRWVLILLIFMLSVPPKLFAQGIVIKGKVLDNNGEAIIGATVFEKNNKAKATVTDLNGDFSLKISASGKRLVITYIGMKPQEVVAVAGKTLTINMALTRGGYSLYPDDTNPLSQGTMKRPDDYKEYYQIAKVYADSVISSSTHHLNKSFRDVFVDECNYIVDNDDDPIFEIPFLKNGSGSVGYQHELPRLAFNC